METVIRALARGLELIEHLQDHSPASLAALHADLGLPKVTLLRLLHTLQEEGWVYRSLGDDRYRLSCHLQHIGDNLVMVDALVEAAGPVLDSLQYTLGCPCEVAVRKGLSMEIVETTGKKSRVGTLLKGVEERPSLLSSAVGQAYVAFCSQTEREEILERLARLPGEPGRLARDSERVAQALEAVRRRGYGEQQAADAEPGWIIAVPVFVEGRIKACISLHGVGSAAAGQSPGERFYSRLEVAARTLSWEVEAACYGEQVLAQGAQALGQGEG
ncbi:helix-turn-helix domain-containing protein [Motiliproteus sp. SC1-56]|uniref:helix-turn-helix domain-containing protein n=1 Tax=Motiliproteus sp. SC1-56 TaxID=2799565 RepID=UPI001A8E8410|nr:helix-turn-helix domain-containing protein [Motiliproteus sp. SC1-56]